MKRENPIKVRVRCQKGVKNFLNKSDDILTNFQSEGKKHYVSGIQFRGEKLRWIDEWCQNYRLTSSTLSVNPPFEIDDSSPKPIELLLKVCRVEDQKKSLKFKILLKQPERALQHREIILQEIDTSELRFFFE